MRLCILWVLLFVLFVSNSYASEVIVPNVASFCASQTDIACPDNFAWLVTTLDTWLAKTKQSLAKKPIALVAAKVDQMLRASQVSEKTSVEELKTRYLRRRLEQWKAEITQRLETIAINASTIRSLRSKYSDDAAFLHGIRQIVVNSLVANKFPRFAIKPYGSSAWLYQDGDGALVVDTITMIDDLDRMLLQRWKQQREKNASEVVLYLTPSDIKKLATVYLFKNKDDLDRLGYGISSSRQRINTDKWYRRHNITTAFHQIWPVRILLPWETISFLKESHFDINDQTLYLSGKVIVSDNDDVDEYGGGLCGAATAMYQWTVTNLWLQQKLRNHSKWFKSLYTATIDGVTEKTPGIDATIYSPNLDYTITNTRPYPLIIVMNYDGSYKGMESVFTLWKEGDKGWISFLKKRTQKMKLATKGWEKTVNGSCYKRDINGKITEKCYKEILP